ncbi:amidohydrolase family protein [Thermodesulfobacteriota bacterium]
MSNKLYEWLNRTTEEALEPDLPICDPHHHLWDYPQSRYMIHEILYDISGGHNIRSTVFIECRSMHRATGPEAMKPVGETEFIQGIAAMSASGQYGETRVAAGIVGHADLCLGESVSSVLEAHLIAGANRFRGIRHANAWDPDERIRGAHVSAKGGMLLDSKFREGFAKLNQYDLSFDAWLYHPQIPELKQLARKFPDTKIILDHVGGPVGLGPYAGRRDEIFSLWKKEINELATCPNVMVKLGGLAMPINGFAWHKREKPPDSEELAEVQQPYYLYCLEKFGVARCMFESNFPVDRVSCSYTVLWNTFKRIPRKY